MFVEYMYLNCNKMYPSGRPWNSEAYLRLSEIQTGRLPSSCRDGPLLRGLCFPDAWLTVRLLSEIELAYILVELGIAGVQVKGLFSRNSRHGFQGTTAGIVCETRSFRCCLHTSLQKRRVCQKMREVVR